MTLEFLKDASNVVLVGPNGVGKSMCACNLGYQAVLAGHTALFTTAGQLLGELAALDSDSALRRKLRQYAAPDLLLIDEVGYLSYSNRHADLLFELVSRRYQHKSTVVTTNRAFADWGEVFPNAACVVSLIDRLMHRAEVVRIDGDSYRAKEARSARRSAWPRSAKAPAARSRKAADERAPWPPSPPAEARVVPLHWTPEQALAVFECLQAMRQALWAAYGPAGAAGLARPARARPDRRPSSIPTSRSDLPTTPRAGRWPTSDARRQTSFGLLHSRSR
jgi:phage tail protein X